MPDQFQALLKAIVEDDSTRVNALLDRDPGLAERTVAKDVLFRQKLLHWVYVGDTLLHVAAAGHRVEIAKSLLDAGADVGAATNRRHSQPLHYASDGNPGSPAWNPERQVAMLRLLLEAGADIQAQDQNGATSLHRAVRTRCTAAVKFLLEAGADATIRNKPGSTPFHLAVQNTGRGGSGGDLARAAQQEIIHAFLEQGVSPKVKDANGKSVLDWARSDWIRQMLTGKAR
jgi:ankyrin repeat protein